MTELELVVDLHKNSERQGPGSEQDTLKALDFMDLPGDRQLEIADIGCGSGGQTIALAMKLNAHITAVDLFPEFLQELNERSEKLNLADKISTLEKSMDELQFRTEEFDVSWSEGASYNIGFDNGIRKWKYFLKPGGYMALSEITWLTHERPGEIEDFWMREYPEIDTAAGKISILEKHGFTLSGYFNLSPYSWIEHYYQPLEERFEVFLQRNDHSEQARKLVEDSKAEIALYLKHMDYYSYGFYIARKN
jgi:cyclopropane fatty-acyl-phospholipid synthase-like methyltransferase